MISGGDLDGDVYMCIWDKDLVDAVKDENICDPAPVDFLDKAAQDDETEHETIQEAVCEFMSRDTLGEFSNLHVAECDKKGPKHPHCIELAGYISV